MAIFRGPQQHVDFHAEMLEAIKRFSPSDVKESAKTLLDASTLAAERRKEADAAEAIIAKAREDAELIAKSREEHESNIVSANKVLDRKYDDLAIISADFAKKRADSLAEISKLKQDADAKILESKNILAAATERHSAADNRDADATAKEVALLAREKKADKRDKDQDERDKKQDAIDAKLKAKKDKLAKALKEQDDE